MGVNKAGENRVLTARQIELSDRCALSKIGVKIFKGAAIPKRILFGSVTIFKNEYTILNRFSAVADKQPDVLNASKCAHDISSHKNFGMLR